MRTRQRSKQTNSGSRGLMTRTPVGQQFDWNEFPNTNRKKWVHISATLRNHDENEDTIFTKRLVFEDHFFLKPRDLKPTRRCMTHTELKTVTSDGSTALKPETPSKKRRRDEASPHRSRHLKRLRWYRASTALLLLGNDTVLVRAR